MKIIVAAVVVSVMVLWAGTASADIWPSGRRGQMMLEEFCAHRIYHRDCRVLLIKHHRKHF